MTPEQTVRLDRVKQELPAKLGATDFEVRVKALIARVDFRTTGPDALWSFDIDTQGTVPLDGRKCTRYTTSVSPGAIADARAAIWRVLDAR